MTNTSIITTSTRSRLPAVAVLADSLRQHQPGLKLTCYLAEDSIKPEDTFENRFDIISVHDLPLPGGKNFLFQYTAFELCCALKPFCMLDQLAKRNADSVVYIDGDMLICAPFMDILNKEWLQHDVLVTRHFSRPEKNTNYLFFLKAGPYNAGFVAARKSKPALETLQWWQSRLASEGYYDYPGGVFADQGWLATTVSTFETTAAPIRHHGINIGHWNLHECDFSEKNGQIMVNDQEPLCVFHFSSFKNPGLTKHDNILGKIPPEIQKLADKYEQMLKKTSSLQNEIPSYSFNNFNNGTLITPALREAVRRKLVNTDDPFKNPDTITAVLPENDPDSILDNRIDHRLYRLQEKCDIQKRQIEHSRKEIEILRNHIKRIFDHPVIGRIMKLWAKYINKNLLNGLQD